jgi:hypothetical protein
MIHRDAVPSGPTVSTDYPASTGVGQPTISVPLLTRSYSESTNPYIMQTPPRRIIPKDEDHDDDDDSNTTENEAVAGEELFVSKDVKDEDGCDDVHHGPIDAVETDSVDDVDPMSAYEVSSDPYQIVG